MPVLDLILDGKVLNSDKHKDLHNHLLRPLGAILVALGATMLLQRIIAPLLEAIMWIMNAGMPCRHTCADYIGSGINALWLIVYAGFELSSDYRSQRVVGCLTMTLAIV